LLPERFFRWSSSLSLSRIARELRLSVTTVSRALGGHGDVAEATRAIVVAEAARIGYRPNVTARRLQSGRAEAVGVVLPNRPGQFDDPFFMKLLTGLGMHLAACDLDLIVTAAPAGADEMRAFQRLVEARRVDGFIIARTRRQDPRVEYLLDRGVPFVTHGRTEARRPHAWLDIDGETASIRAMERLIGFGHRRIGFLNAPDIYMFAHYRAAGWRRALAEAGLAAGPVLTAEPTEENGFLLAQAMLAQPRPPTALLCATHRLAVGALHGLSQAGLRVGRDVSIIGYGDMPDEIRTDPPLTTMDQMVDRGAERLVEMLTAILAGADPATHTELWQAKLIARESDGPVMGGPVMGGPVLDAPVQDRPVLAAPAGETTAPERARAVKQYPNGGTDDQDISTA
jgi:LacI family transcriptional regulator